MEKRSILARSATTQVITATLRMGQVSPARVAPSRVEAGRATVSSTESPPLKLQRSQTATNVFTSARKHLNVSMRYRLSPGGALKNSKRDAADAAAAAAALLQKVRQQRDSARSELERRRSQHDHAQRERMDRINERACAHMADRDFKQIHDLRLLPVVPPRTEHCARCACTVLRAVSGANDGTAERRAAALCSWTEAHETLTRNDLRLAIARLDVLRLAELGAVAAAVARAADFGSVTARAANARALGEPRRAKTGLSLLQRATAKISLLRLMGMGGGGAKGGAKESAGGVDGASASEDEDGAMRRLRAEEAAASTSAAGALFVWLAHVLAGVCELIDHDRAAQPPIALAAARLDALEAELQAATAACAREESVLARASLAKAEFEHDRRVAAQSQIAAVRIEQKRAAAVAAAAADDEQRARREALHATLDGPHAVGRALKEHPSAITGWLKPGHDVTVVDLTAEEDEEDEQGSLETRRARELAQFARVREEAEARHVSAALAEGGLLLG
jgi:hypothetical protein